LNEGLNVAAYYGAEYADIRIEELQQEDISVKNNKVENIDFNDSLGFGVRVLKNGSWGFASSSLLNLEEIRKTVKKAIEIAESGLLVKSSYVNLAPNPVITAKFVSPYKIDPFKVSLGEKIELLLKTSELISKYQEIKHAEVTFSCFRHFKFFASSEGSYIEQEFIKTGAGFQVWAINDDDLQIRSYPANCGGDFQAQGYEFVLSLKMPENVPKICEEAISLLQAEQCPAGEKTIIIDSNQLANQIHESIGHPTEFDRVLGMEASFAGTSFLTMDKLNTLKYGSDLVNVVSDATIPGAFGSYGFDDEGVPAKRVNLIKNGIFSGYLTSRETATILGQESSGAMKATNWNYLPLIRMPNINLEPGTWNLEDLLADTDDGIYFCTNKSWSIDDKRWNFQFSTEIAWEIKKGKLGKIYKNPTYTDNTVHFWNSCDAICNSDYWQIWGIPNCGKGQPMQTGHVGHGAAPSRFRNIRVGVLE